MIRNIAKSFWDIAIAGAINFEAKKIYAGCIPHLYWQIKNGYEYKPLAIAKTVSKIQTKTITNSVIGDETLVYYFEQVRTIRHLKAWSCQKNYKHESMPQRST